MLDLGRAAGQAERVTLPRAREVRRCFGIALNVYISGPNEKILYQMDQINL